MLIQTKIQYLSVSSFNSKTGRPLHMVQAVHVDTMEPFKFFVKSASDVADLQPGKQYDVEFSVGVYNNEMSLRFERVISNIKPA